MEEEKYTAYDLEEKDQRSEVRTESSEESGSLDDSKDSKGSKDAEDSESLEEAGRSEAEVEIERMVKEMGAETLLGIIRDNRNNAIEQIIGEIQSAAKPPLPSGVSAGSQCSSIFDLAAMA